jgi:DNA ligase (NAD+)
VLKNQKKPRPQSSFTDLGIRFIGEQTAKLLADHFLTVESFMKTKTAEELEKIPEIGPKVSASILKWTQDE